jgi:hypothetical protein
MQYLLSTQTKHLWTKDDFVMFYMTTAERVTCFMLSQQGWSQRRIARHLERSLCVIQQLSGEYKKLKRTGQPRISSERDDRTLIRMSQQQIQLTSLQLQSGWRHHELNAFCFTVNRLNTPGLHDTQSVAARVLQ